MDSEQTEVSPLTELHSLLEVNALQSLRYELRAQRDKLKDLDWAVFQLELGLRAAADPLALWECASIMEKAEHPKTFWAYGLLARLFAELGATEVCDLFADKFRKGLEANDAPQELQWLAEQVEGPPHRGADADGHNGWRALMAGDAAAACESFKKSLANGNAGVIRVLASVEFSLGRFADGAQRLFACWQKKQSVNQLWALEACYATWLSGDKKLALELALELRKYHALANVIDKVSGDFILALEKGDAEPRLAGVPTPLTWKSGQESVVRAFAQEHFGKECGGNDLAQLTDELRAAGIGARRVIVDNDIPSILSEGKLIVAEERPVGMGLTWIQATDEITGCLVAAPLWKVGCEIRSYQYQAQLSKLYGFRGIVVSERQKIGPDNEQATVLDRCYEKVHGKNPPRSQFRRLADDAVESAPDIQEAWMLKGEAIVAQLMANDIDAESNGPFEQWYSQVRDKFADAEWASQIYGRALEHWGLPYEAGIVWSDALLEDEKDYRNHQALGRLRGATGISSSVKGISEALLLHPASVESWVLAANDFLVQQDYGRADYCSQVAASVAPSSGTALLARGDLLDRKGHRLPAQTMFRKALLDSDVAHLAARRLCVHNYFDGDWQGANHWAARLRQGHPAMPDGWIFGELASRGEAACDEAVELMLFYCERWRVAPFMVDEIATTLADCFTEGELVSRAMAFCERLMPSGQDLAFATAIGNHQPEVAVELLSLLGDGASDAINWQWAKAQQLLGCLRRSATTSDELLDRTAEALQATIEQTGDFPFPKLCLSWVLRLHDARQAITNLKGVDPVVPVAFWWVSLELSQYASDARVADELTRRIVQAPDSEIARGIDLLRSYQLHDAALSLARFCRQERNGLGPKASAPTIMALLEQGQYDKAMQALHQCPETDIGASNLAYLYLRQRHFEEANTIAEKEIKEMLSDSSIHHDPWPLKAISHWAAFELTGEPMISVGSHPRALAVLTEGGDEASAKSLASVAPGLSSRVQEGDWWWR